MKDLLKKKLKDKKGSWLEELVEVLRAYRTTKNISTKETLFFLVYRINAVIPAEIRVPTHRVTYFSKARNKELLVAVVNLAEKKKRLDIALKIVVY